LGSAAADYDEERERLKAETDCSETELLRTRVAEFRGPCLLPQTRCWDQWYWCVDLL